MNEVTVVIPTYNRALLTVRAVEAALSQSYLAPRVLVVDDASTDNTRDALSKFIPLENFSYVQLKENLGTAHAKNVGLMLCNTEAITFHDSDDIPARDKLTCQAHTLFKSSAKADAALNWDSTPILQGHIFKPDVVLSGHDIVLPTGQVKTVNNDLSLMDDFFPQVSIGSDLPGDWVHINSGLFRRSVFERIGGFDDCIEEDRDLRNRILIAGFSVRVMHHVLLRKFECEDSLTQAVETNYESPKRKADRTRIWKRISQWRKGEGVAPVIVDIPNLRLRSSSLRWPVAEHSVFATRETSCRLRSELFDCESIFKKVA